MSQLCPRQRPPHAPELRRQMVHRVHADRSPDDLAQWRPEVVRRNACVAPAPAVSITRSVPIGSLAVRFSSALRKALVEARVVRDERRRTLRTRRRSHQTTACRPRTLPSARAPRARRLARRAPGKVAVKRVAGYGAVNKLNRTNLDDTMAVERVKAGYLGVDDNLTHGATGSPNLY